MSNWLWSPVCSLPPDSFQWSSLSDFTAGDRLHSWHSGAELPENRSPPQMVSSPSLADLLALYAATGERRQQPLERSLPATHLDEQDGSPEDDDWSMVSKKKRNFSLGVAGMCCSQGCTKNDIGRLCWVEEEERQRQKKRGGGGGGGREWHGGGVMDSDRQMCTSVYSQSRLIEQIPVLIYSPYFVPEIQFCLYVQHHLQ